MKVIVSEPEYRQVTIVLENRDQLDQLISILSLVSNNVIHYKPAHINAARNMFRILQQKLIDEGIPL